MQSNFSFRVSPSDASVPLGLRVYFDSAVIADHPHIDRDIDITVPFDDSQEQSHTVEIELYNKLPQHTVIDQQGAIVQDTVLNFSNITLDSVEFNETLLKTMRYQHNFNGHGENVEEEFHGCMGCNGRTRLVFSSPVYIWILENM